MKVLFILALIFSAIPVWAATMPAFTKFEKGAFAVQPKSEKTVSMPRVLSQDTLGLCYSFAAAAMLTAENCRIMKKDCKNLPDSEVFSPVDVARFGRQPDGEADYESSYRGIHEGGPGAFTLEIAGSFVGNSASQECLSLDKILGKMGGATFGTDAQLAAFKRLRKKYDEYQKIDKNCETCLTDFFATAKTEMDKDFNLDTDPTRLLKAFGEETYEKFFDRLIYPKECSRAKNRAYYEGKDTTELKVFPSKGKNADYAGAMEQIKKQLENGHPVMVSGICLNEKYTKDCSAPGVEGGNQHATVISGYRRVCDKANKCYDALQIHNSWGQAWQDMYDGGWVDAESLLKFTGYETEMLAWLEDKPKGK